MAVTDRSEEIWTAVRARLLADPAIAAIVGTKVFRTVARDAPLPYIVASSIEADDNGTSDTDSETVRVELHIWGLRDDAVTVGSEKVPTAARLKSLVRTALHWSPVGLRCTVERSFGPLPDPNPDALHYVVIVSALAQHVETV